jgi:hypothetical protein
MDPLWLVFIKGKMKLLHTTMWLGNIEEELTGEA